MIRYRSELSTALSCIAALALLSGAIEPARALPLMSTNPSKTLQGIQASSFFGSAAVTAGDIDGDGFSDLLVGAPTFDGGLADEGKLSIFRGSANGLGTTPIANIQGEEASARMGESVACLGDVNGDGFQDYAASLINGGATDAGTVQVFHGNDIGSIDFTPDRILNGSQANASFGVSISAAGDVNGDGFQDLLVGENRFDNGQTNEGRALLYLGSASGIAATTAWTFESNSSNANLGFRVSPAGDVNGDGRSDVIIGSLGFSNGHASEGAAWVFHGTPSGLSTTPNWTTEGNQAQANYGSAVANAGDVNGDGYADVIVGAPLFDNGQTDEGRVYLFLGSASGLSTTAAVVHERNQVGAELGAAVGTAGDVNGDGFADYMMGAPKLTNVAAEEGAAFLHLGNSTAATLPVAFSFSEGEAFSQFGYSVGTAGDTNGDGFSDLLIGAPAFDARVVDDGAVFVYHGSAGPPATTPFWNEAGAGPDNLFGWDLDVVGDVNADGFDDVVVGEFGFDGGGTADGRIQLFRGGLSGLAQSANQTILAPFPNASFSGWGRDIVRAGDVTGDGLDDVLFGASSWDPEGGNDDLGRVELFVGSSGGLVHRQTWIGDPHALWGGSQLGTSVAGADVNGDGFFDVIIGDPISTIGAEPLRGRVLVYYGSESGPDLIPEWEWSGEPASQFFGMQVARAGDVNNDGFDDVLIAQADAPGFGNNKGYVSLYLGSDSGLGAAPTWTRAGGDSNEQFGQKLAGIGDVNGDGFADVAIFSEDAVGLSAGIVSVFLGNATGLETAPAITYQGNQFPELLGFGLSTAGDVNADGYSDLIVGAPFQWHSPSQEGYALLFLGGPTGLGSSPVWNVADGDIGDQFGHAVSGGGDFNGDGFSDVIVGCPSNNQTPELPGQAFAYYGNEVDGLSRKFSQRRMAETERISTGSQTFASALAFDIVTNLRSAAGRERVRTEFARAEDGAPFGAFQTVVAFLDTEVPEVVDGSALEVRQTIVGLLPGSRYSWRMRHTCRNPYFPHGPTLYPQGNALRETDLRAIAITADVDDLVNPSGIDLALPMPNPTSRTAMLTFTLAASTPVKFSLHDASGRVVRQLHSGSMDAGTHRVAWDGRDENGVVVASGVYFARLEGPAGVSTRKLVVRR